jgi:hypothetical protein
MLLMTRRNFIQSISLLCLPSFEAGDRPGTNDRHSAIFFIQAYTARSLAEVTQRHALSRCAAVVATQPYFLALPYSFFLPPPSPSLYPSSSSSTLALPLPLPMFRPACEYRGSDRGLREDLAPSDLHCSFVAGARATFDPAVPTCERHECSARRQAAHCAWSIKPPKRSAGISHQQGHVRQNALSEPAPGLRSLANESRHRDPRPSPVPGLALRVSRALSLDD